MKRALAIALLLLPAACGGGDAPAPPPPPKEKKPAKPKVDVSKWENEGKKKCETGLSLVRQRVGVKTAVDPEIVRFDLEAAHTQLTEGLDAYKIAADKSKKTYDLAKYVEARDKARHALCESLETEAKASCDKGLAMIRQCESLMSGRTLSDAERTKLRTGLQEGKDLIEKGMNLFDRSHAISGNTFDTTSYGQARKAASMKLLEMKKE